VQHRELLTSIQSWPDPTCVQLCTDGLWKFCHCKNYYNRRWRQKVENSRTYISRPPT